MEKLRELQEGVDDTVTDLTNLQLLSTELNAQTVLSVCVRPFCYDVKLGEKNVLSLNHLKNAVTIYHVMRADFRGEIYDG